jgi:peptide/nickel transport system ATP-binding protein
VSRVLTVERLRIQFSSGETASAPVRDVSFVLDKGETLCIVGESGSGKSLTALAVMDLLPRRAERSAVRLDFCGEDLASASRRRVQELRGNRVGMIFQDPTTALNPLYTIGNQLEEVWREHRGGSGRDRVVHLLERVGISGAAERLNQYPHQLSGGLRQRVMIAMALLCEPQLVIADEPTTALDVTVQAQILSLLASLQREFGMALMLITHDFGVVSQIADRVAVMYAGQIVETGSTRDVLDTPFHPYTRALLDCIPEPGRQRLQPLGVIPGMVPSRITDAPGCTFANRCSLVQAGCWLPPVIPLRENGNGRTSRCILSSPIQTEPLPTESTA